MYPKEVEGFGERKRAIGSKMGLGGRAGEKVLQRLGQVFVGQAPAEELVLE